MTITERLGRLDRRSLWTGLEATAAPIGSVLIAVGLIQTLGPQDYGLLIMLLAISNLSLAVNPAIAAATTRFIAEAVGRREDNQSEAEISQSITASLTAVALVSVVLVAIVALGGEPLARLTLGQAGQDTEYDLALLLLLAVTSVCLLQTDGVLGAALRGLERFRKQAALEVLLRISLAVVVVMVGWLGAGLRGVLTTYCVVCAVSLAVRALAVKLERRDRHLLLAPSRRHLMRVATFGGWMWMNALATALYTSLDRIYIGAQLGSAAAGEYTLYVQFAQLVHFVPASLLAFSFPVFSRLAVQKRGGALSEIRRLYASSIRTSLTIAILMALAIWLCYVMFTDRLASVLEVDPNTSCLIILLTGFCVLSISIAPYYLNLGLGRARAVSLITSSSTALALLLTFALTPIFGISGAAGARWAYALGTLTLIVLGHRHVRGLRNA